MLLRLLAALGLFAIAGSACSFDEIGEIAVEADSREQESVIFTPSIPQEAPESTQVPSTESAAEQNSTSVAETDSAPSASEPTAIQLEIIEWRTFQRQYAQGQLPNGETAEESACIVEVAIRSVPEELLPQLTNPARELLEFSTIDVLAQALADAEPHCL